MRKKDYNKIEFIKIFKKIIFNKYKIFRITFVFFFLGLLISLFSPVMYLSNLKFFPTSLNTTSKSSLAGLASIAGLNIELPSESSTLINPNLYPINFNDFKFRRELLNIELNNNFTLKDYILLNNKPNFFSIIKEYTLGLPLKFISLFYQNYNNYNNNNLYIDKEYLISDEERSFFNYLDNIIFLNYNIKNFIIEISAELNNPVYSSLITRGAYKLLEKKIIDYNIKSSKDLLDFNLKNFLIKKNEFSKIQNKLAEFKDKNQVISSSKFNTELFILENEFNLINSVYIESAKQVELSKIKVTQDTPVFTILKDADIPNSKNKPKRLLIIISWTLLGLTTSLVFIFINNFILKTINNLRN